MESSEKVKAHAALAQLTKKYGVDLSHRINLHKDGRTARALSLLQGWKLIGSTLTDGDVPLCPWRTRRSLIELRNVVTDGTLENPCLFRFSCMSSNSDWTLPELMYREFDLLEFICGEQVASVYAVIKGNAAANLLLKTTGNLLCSIELSTQLPKGMKPLERHEIIAQRGIASDLVVDTQIQQSSVYCLTLSGNEEFTDVDAELFGFDALTQEHIRAAFEFLRNSASKHALVENHKRISKIIAAAYESDQRRIKITIN